jgi:pyruvate,water dikinase
MINPLKLFAKDNVCIPLVDRAGKHVVKYRLFRNFLVHNRSAMDIIALIEALYYSGNPFTLAKLGSLFEELLESAFGAVYSLEGLSGKHFPALVSALNTINAGISRDLEPHYAFPTSELVLPFDRITPTIKNAVGAKAANLAGAGNKLMLSIPQGFAITAYAFKRFMDENGLWGDVHNLFSTVCHDTRLDQLEKRCKEIQSLVTSAPVPEDVAEAIHAAYRALEEQTHPAVRIAMRSSAVGEDDQVTFAGQYATALNVKKENILESYKAVIASKYSARAVSYALKSGLDHRETPMGVAGIVMIDAKVSGVLYTADPATQDASVIKIHALWGLGDYLVSGSALPDFFLVDKKEHTIIKREINQKEYRLKSLEPGGTGLEAVPSAQQSLPSIQDDAVLMLADVGARLEEFFGCPQDVEWAVDQSDKLFVLQTRPLHLSETAVSREDGITYFSGHLPLAIGGETASPGVAVGTVFVIREGAPLIDIPENSIVIVKTASPNYVKYAGMIRGIVTEIGSTASHLGSVLREFGIPAIFGMRDAMTRLGDGLLITLDATHAAVYDGVVKNLLEQERPQKRKYIASAIHQRTRGILDAISPLNLTDPNSPSFTPETCRTVHDVIRYTHEATVREMFGLTNDAESMRSMKLTARIPLTLHVIDLGGGLRPGLNTCDMVTPGDIESVPMKAIWKGFTHPGITWEGTMGFDPGKLLTLMAAAATSELGETPGGNSYAIISGDYLNLSAKFGYHFAAIDCLCGENVTQNYISLQFAGGAGSYYGKTLRVAFLGSVLERLGFQVTANGDIIEAFVTGYDQPHMEEKLDQIGRLLASSRLLDMALTNQSDVARLSDAFFNEEYDYLSSRPDEGLRNFYMHGGNWQKIQEKDRTVCLQDGSKAGFIVSTVAFAVGKLVSQPMLHDFLDRRGAYFYFPLAIAKESKIGDGMVRVRVKPLSGNIDRAGGIVFGLRDVSNYYVLRINALEDNVSLFEYVNSRRIERASFRETIRTGKWHGLRVEVHERNIRCFLNNRVVLEYDAGSPVHGYIGLWTKADSVTFFDELVIEADGGITKVVC